MNILITGGAGYIGSHVTKLLGKGEFNITVLDNLSKGHMSSVTSGELVVGDLADLELMEKLFAEKKFDGVIHFAASTVVPESIDQPDWYYRNNYINSHTLVDLCLKHKVPNFIFSSTAAVYGDQSEGIPINEELYPMPGTPYGKSKLMVEWLLQDVSKAYGLNFVCLRYFNVAGADMAGELGPKDPKATHLIKVCAEVAAGNREEIQVYGTDYPTNDGTAERDFIHVDDLAQAHLDALNHLLKGGKSLTLNCGYGKGTSVQEVINHLKEVSGNDFKVVHGPRRQGDLASVMAVSNKIKTELNWIPKYNDIRLIVKSAYDWEVSWSKIKKNFENTQSIEETNQTGSTSLK